LSIINATFTVILQMYYLMTQEYQISYCAADIYKKQ